VFEWHDRFREGRDSLQDDERKGRPSTCSSKVSGRRSDFECSDVRRNYRDQ
jgi:hypothetical protein